MPNNTVLERAGITSMYTLLKQRCLRWLDLVSRMEDGRIPEDLLYGELATGKRPTGRPQLHLKDICKRDVKARAFNTDTWETLACDRCAWRQKVQKGLSSYKNTQQPGGGGGGGARRKSQSQTESQPRHSAECTVR